MQEYLVSIIIPTFNRAHFIGQTLDSVLAQTYQDWECIVVDDGSNDYTDELLEFYTEKDDRIQYHHRPENRPKGANACRNFGFELSKGEYINWLDSDDLLSKNKIEEQLKVINKAKSIDIIYGRWMRFNDDLNQAIDTNPLRFYKTYKTGFIFLEAMGRYKTFMASHSYLVSRQLIYKVGLWNEYLTSNQDGDFFNKVLLYAREVKFSQKSVSYYRTNSNISVSSYSSEKKIRDKINSWKLIEVRMRLIYENSDFYYIMNAKKRIFIDLRKSDFSYLINEYNHFFANALIEEKKYLKSKTLRKRIVRKVKSILKS